MAKVVSEFPLRTSKQNKYDWDSWLDGRVWVVTRGVDFSITPSGMQASVHQAAKRRGLTARTSVRGDDVYIVVISKEDAE